MSLVLMLASGGNTLDEVEVLRTDIGLNRLIGDLAAPNSLGEFLRRVDRFITHDVKTTAYIIQGKRIGPFFGPSSPRSLSGIHNFRRRFPITDFGNDQQGAYGQPKALAL